MSKLTLTDLSNFNNASVAAVSANNTAIEAALENTLSRDGTSPNQMEADLDLNHNDILNVATLDADTVVVNGVDIETLVNDAATSASEAAASAVAADNSASSAAASAQTAAELVADAMTASVYDPTGIEADVFDMDNMLDGANKVAMTVQERARFQTIKTPYDYGADPSDAITVDQSAAVQALIDAVRASYNNTLRGFTMVADFAGRIWHVNTSINLTNLRQPGITLQNGHIHGSCTGKTVLDMAGTNTPVLLNLLITGDKTNVPAIGIYRGISKNAGAITTGPDCRFINVKIEGFFSKAALASFSAEVSLDLGCRYSNNSRSLTAYAEINCAHAKTFDDYVGGVTSDYTDLPLAADGPFSNILHWTGQTSVWRGADVAIPVISITKANPAVVAVNSASLIASGLANGAKVFFGNVSGMTQLIGQVCTVANINTGAGTFELSGVNSTGYGTFTSGNVWNQTGPALLISGVEMLHGRSGYFLTYGSPAIVIDHVNHGVRSIDLEFSSESHAPCMVRIDKPSSGTSVIQGLRLKDIASGQSYTDTIIDDAGNGLCRIDDLELIVSSMGTAPPNKTFKNASRFYLLDPTIKMPLAAALNATSDFYAVVNGGSFSAFNRADVRHEFFRRFYGGPEFYGTTASPRAGRAVMLDDAGNVGPFWDLFTDSASPAFNDGLGYLRLLGRDSAGNEQLYGGVRGRILDPANGSEDGQIDLMTTTAGAETVAFAVRGDGLYYQGSSKVLGERVTGFTTAAGTANKNASGINVDTITATDADVRALAAWVKALHDAMATHGSIGA